jgi:hypothetical protein
MFASKHTGSNPTQNPEVQTNISRQANYPQEREFTLQAHPNYKYARLPDADLIHMQESGKYK